MTPVLSPTRSFARNRVMLLAGTTVAVSLLTGCGGMHGIKSAQASPSERQVAKSDAQADKAVIRAEVTVQKRPEDATARAALGSAYLVAGRFESAATSYEDAMELGDTRSKTALSLALARIGGGHHREAVALLDEWRGEIPAGDLGLALALAGETSRGVAVLVDAVRSGESTPKLRQNLAYAYALDGRWSEAKRMAEQDIPAELLNKRLALWALSTLPDRNQERVAALIGAPVRLMDPGQPAALALKAAPEAPQVAAASAMPVEVSAVAAPSAAEPRESVALQSVEAAQSLPTTVAANIAVQAAPSVRQVPLRLSVAQAFAPEAARPAAAERAAPRRELAVSTRLHPATGLGSHFVQLGAFSSELGARRAWGIYSHRDPGLSAYRMTITTATVNGKQVWRVAAGGIEGRYAATNLCSQLKSRGGACFAYAAPLRTLANPAAPTHDVAGPQRARRR